MTVVGKGQGGNIYEACSADEEKRPCDWVVKEFSPDDNSYWLDLLAFKTNVGPRAFPIDCEGKRYLVQERMDGTLTDYIREKGRGEGGGEASTTILNEEELRQIRNLVLKMMRFFHNDLHSDNIMYKKKRIGFYLIAINSFFRGGISQL